MEEAKYIHTVTFTKEQIDESVKKDYDRLMEILQQGDTYIILQEDDKIEMVKIPNAWK